jgi:hypothetical protein
MAFNNFVILNKLDIVNAQNHWIDNNPNCKYPTTEFYESVGLVYRKLLDSGSLCFIVADQQKYMLAKIKYGI